jgi:hypothetical protein
MANGGAPHVGDIVTPSSHSKSGYGNTPSAEQASDVDLASEEKKQALFKVVLKAKINQLSDFADSQSKETTPGPGQKAETILVTPPSIQTSDSPAGAIIDTSKLDTNTAADFPPPQPTFSALYDAHLPSSDWLPISRASSYSSSLPPSRAPSPRNPRAAVSKLQNDEDYELLSPVPLYTQSYPSPMSSWALSDDASSLGFPSPAPSAGEFSEAGKEEEEEGLQDYESI